MAALGAVFYVFVITTNRNRTSKTKERTMKTKILQLITAWMLLAVASLQAAGIDYTNLLTLSTLGTSIRSASTRYGYKVIVTCSSGGSSLAGTIFEYDVAANTATLLHTFTPFQGTNGSSPNGALVLIGDTFYGTTVAGGTNPSYGVMFKFVPSTGTFTKIRDFGGTIGTGPESTLCVFEDKLAGNTQGGGTYNMGTIFCLDTNGATQWTKALDGTNGRNVTQLISIGDHLYGASYSGGAHGDGLTFRIKKDGTGMTTLFSWSGDDGAYPNSLILGPDGKMYGTVKGEYDEALSSVFVMGTNGIPTTLMTVDDEHDYATGVSFATNGLMYVVTAGSGYNSNAGRIYQLGTNGSSLLLTTFPPRSTTVTQLYAAPITFGLDNRGYLGFAYTNVFGRLSLPQWTVFNSITLTCTNTTYQWRSVAGQTYALQLADAVNGQWSNHSVTATSGVSKYVSGAFVGRTSEFARLIVYTTNTMSGFDVGMTNGAIMIKPMPTKIDQRDTNCIAPYVPCTNCPPPGDPPNPP